MAKLYDIQIAGLIDKDYQSSFILYYILLFAIFLFS